MKRDATSPSLSERDEAIILANKVLDRINADPDDDLCVLARQFLRAVEATMSETGTLYDEWRHLNAVLDEGDLMDFVAAAAEHIKNHPDDQSLHGRQSRLLLSLARRSATRATIAETTAYCEAGGKAIGEHVAALGRECDKNGALIRKLDTAAHEFRGTGAHRWLTQTLEEAIAALRETPSATLGLELVREARKRIQNDTDKWVKAGHPMSPHAVPIAVIDELIRAVERGEYVQPCSTCCGDYDSLTGRCADCPHDGDGG
jgi:hypothetical protein